MDKDEILFFMKGISNDFQILNSTNMILQLSVNDLKVDFVQYEYPYLEEVYKEKEIRYLGKKDISAMKLSAVSQRGDKAKDFIDVYYLLKEMSLNEMFENYKNKFNQRDISHVKKSLIYFDDVEPNNWKSVNLLKEKLDINKIKTTLIKAVNDYEEYIVKQGTLIQRHDSKKNNIDID
jgi:accessory colonization factor AcfC